MYDIVNGFVLCFLCAFRDLAATRAYLFGFGRGRALKFVAYKVLVFVVGAAMASVAGVIYTHYISFIDPTSFTVMESIFIISIMIICGFGNHEIHETHEQKKRAIAGYLRFSVALDLLYADAGTSCSQMNLASEQRRSRLLKQASSLCLACPLGVRLDM